MIVEIRDKGTTVIWVVEENPTEVLKHADRVYLMDSGIIKMERTGKQFLEEENLEELFLGSRRGKKMKKVSMAAISICTALTVMTGCASSTGSSGIVVLTVAVR